MVSFLEFIREAKTVRASPKPTPKYNRGQKYERGLIGGLVRTGLGRVGVLSKRGNDAFIKLPNGREHTLSIKAHAAAAGQVQFGGKRGGRGWGYSTKEPQGQGLVRSLRKLGGEGEMSRHYGKKSPIARGKQMDRVRAVTRKKGELHVPLAANRHQIARILRQGSNGDDLMHIRGKGTYAMTPRIARATGINYIGDKIDVDSEPLTVRHRHKTHSSAKGGKAAVKSMTAQLNFDKDALEKSDHSVVLQGIKRKKD